MFKDSPTSSTPYSDYGSLFESQDEPPLLKLPFTKVMKTIRTIASATLTASLSLIFTAMINFVSLAFISRFNNAAMIGGLGLGFVSSNCCVYILITSIDQGVNALAAQAFGAKKPDLVSLNYHRGLFCLFIVLIPVMVLMAFTKQILIAVGIEEEISEFAWQYIKFAYPSYVFYAIFDCTKAYLFAQKIFNPILYTQMATTALHFGWSWIFVAKLGLGAKGAGIAKTIYEFSNMLIIVIYIHTTRRCEENWVPFRKIQWRHVLQWHGMKTFLRVVIPISALLFLDMACYEIFSILAGQFGDNQLAVHIAIANSAALYYSFPLGLSVVLMTFVGNAMGEGSPRAAKNLTYCGLILDVAITAVFVAALWFLRQPWADLLSPNGEVRDILLQVLVIYILFIFFDGVQVALSGTIKGIGKQTMATIGLIITYYVFALPLIYWLAFRQHWMVKGIWGGFLIGIIILFVIYIIVLCCTDFKKQAKKIKDKLTDL